MNNINSINNLNTLSISIKSCDEMQKQKDDALYNAVEEGNADDIKKWINQGANPLMTATNGFNLLHISISKGNEDIWEFLLNKGLDVNSVTKSPSDCSPDIKFMFPEMPKAIEETFHKEGFKLTPLLIAASNNNSKAAEWLLSKGANVDIVDNFGLNPLLHSLSSGSVEITDLLIKNGSDINITFPKLNGSSMIHLLCIVNNEKALDIALKYNPNVNIQNLEGNTALHDCAIKNFVGCATKLLEAGIDVNIRAKDGTTPLHLAAFAGNDDMVVSLLSKGADPIACDENLCTPLLIHKKFKETKLMKSLPLLEKADSGFTDLITDYKMIGHRFHIDQSQFESLSKYVTFPFITRSIRCYLQNTQNPIMENALKLMEKSYLHQDNLEFFLKEIEGGNPVIIYFNWPEHALCLGIYKNYIFRCNRGLGANDRSGILIDEITDREKIKDVLKILMNFDLSSEEINEQANKGNIENIKNNVDNFKKEKQSHGIKFFYDEFEKILGLKRIKFIPQKPQSTGNCGYLAVQQSFRLGCIFGYLKENSEIKDAIADGLKEYKKWSFFDRKYLYDLQYHNILRDDRIKKVADTYLLEYEIKNQNFKESKIEFIRHFLKGKDPYFLQRGIHEAIAKKSIRLINLMMEMGGDVNKIIEFDKTTPLICCASKGDKNILLFLLELGANVNLQTPDGNFALLAAYRENQLEMMDLLLENGADPKMVNTDTQSPLDLAKLSNNEGVLEIYRKHKII